MARTKQVATKGGAAKPGAAKPSVAEPVRHTSNIPAKDPKDVIIYKLKEENLSLKQQLARKSGMSLHDWRLEFDPSYFPSITGNASIVDFLEKKQDDSKEPEEEKDSVVKSY